MATTLNFKKVIDLPMWRPNSPPIGGATAGVSMAWDMRNNENNNPYTYLLRSAILFDVYDAGTDEWMPLASPALTGTFGAGATCIFNPSAGPRGVIAAGATVSSVILSTVLPAAVAINQLANRGDSRGRKIRICGLAAGKVEERRIVANSAGTTPTIYVDTPFSFTPAANDLYEIRSGRVFLLSAGTLAAGMWKYYDIATNSYSGNLATTNLPATVGGDSSLVALSESYVPYSRDPGEGFVAGGATSDSKECIQCTATGAASITGSGMPATLQADEYRNFQVRIVEDANTPASVGQRRRISTHTGGAAGVFTVAAWATQPSNVAKFVIENDDDKILLFTNQTSVYTYNITGNTWDTTTFAAAGNAGGAGIIAEQAFGIVKDDGNYARNSMIFRVRGAAGNQIDVLDIAAAATGTWSADIAYQNKSQTFTTGTCGAYNPVTEEGRFLYICVNGTQRHARFDLKNRVMDPATYLRMPQGTAVVGQKCGFNYFFDGSTKLGFLFELLQTTANMYSIAIQG